MFFPKDGFQVLNGMPYYTKTNSVFKLQTIYYYATQRR